MLDAIGSKPACSSLTVVFLEFRAECSPRSTMSPKILETRQKDSKHRLLKKKQCSRNSRGVMLVKAQRLVSEAQFVTQVHTTEDLGLIVGSSGVIGGIPVVRLTVAGPLPCGPSVSIARCCYPPEAQHCGAQSPAKVRSYLEGDLPNPPVDAIVGV